MKSSMSQDIALLRQRASIYKEISTGFLYPEGEELKSEHFRLFGPDPLCPLDITYYLSDDIFMQTKLMADIAGFYRAFGLETKENLKVDHLSICFEFLSYLCLKQLYAFEKGYEEKLKITEDAFHSFFDEFIKPALPKFLTLLREHSRAKFYKGLADLTEKTITDGER